MRSDRVTDKTRTLELLAKYRANGHYGKRQHLLCFARHCTGSH